MFAARNRSEKRILTKGTERQGKSFQIVVANCLVRKCQNKMLKPGRADCGNGFGD